MIQQVYWRDLAKKSKNHSSPDSDTIGGTRVVNVPTPSCHHWTRYLETHELPQMVLQRILRNLSSWQSWYFLVQRDIATVARQRLDWRDMTSHPNVNLAKKNLASSEIFEASFEYWTTSSDETSLENTKTQSHTIGVAHPQSGEQLFFDAASPLGETELYILTESWSV